MRLVFLPSSVRSMCPRPLAGLLLLAAMAIGVAAHADDPAAEFTPTSNLATSRWSYGWTPIRGGAFTLFTTFGTDAFGLNYWNNAGNQTLVNYNGTGVPKNIGNNTTIPAGGLSLFPGSAGQYAVVRWTASVAGTYSVNARFIRRSTNTYVAADVAVLQGANVVFSRWLTNDVSNVVSMAASLAVAAGDHIDFAVGPGDGGNNSDMIGLDATLNLEPVAGPAGPVVYFAGQRFVACMGDTAFESLAYDPVNQRIASRGIIRDRLGLARYQGPDESPGLAWDSKTGTYWQVTNNRTVRRWSATGTLLDTVFTVPLTFTVPGWGLDTLESVKGIATDSTYVYFVDAGDAGTQGQIYSNEWFKFTRAGAPVKSSKTTNFHATLDLNPDAVVDDIVYMPYSSVLLPGRLLIPLEHSGLQVIDTDGNFVSKFRWTDAGVPPGLKLSAFAGLGADPVTGNLYLVENDGGTSQIWVRLPQGGATYYVLGTGSNDPWLHYPNPGSNRPSWRALPPEAGLTFGSAYRTVNRTVYGVDFGSTQLSRFNPATGSGGRVAITGAASMWGMAYDTERDVLYGGIETGSGDVRILVIDPVTGTASPLPNTVGNYTRDLAFNPVDHKIYGVASVSGGPKLIRIDRDTGLGAVGPATADVVGIDYEPASGRLIGIHNSGTSSNATLYSIDPTTGASTTITTLLHNARWEGLSVVPVPAAPVLATEPPLAPGSSSLRVAPNPTRGASTLQFSLPQAADVEAAVYDVTGRKIRTIGTGHYTAGRHTLAWDGRDAEGRPVASGVYFVRLDRGTESLVARTVKIE